MRTVIEKDRVTFTPETKAEHLALFVISDRPTAGMTRLLAGRNELCWVEYRFIDEQETRSDGSNPNRTKPVR